MKLSQLPSTSSPTSVDIVPIVQSGTTKQTALSNLPVSTPVATALGLKADANNSNLTGTTNVANLTVSGTTTGISKASVGLGNVDNTSDANKPVSTAQQTAMNVIGSYGSVGLVGTPNSTTPLTKYDLSADAITMRNSAGATVTRYNVAVTTCDLGLAGSTANGRDVAGVFGINSWVYLYFIWNGTTVATLASLTAPSAFTGSTLPAGYTHWAFATAVRWNASSNIIPVLTRGSRVLYNADLSTARVLSSGVATTMTTVSLTGFVPPCSQRALLCFYLSVASATTGPYICSYRATGATGTGLAIVSVSVQVGGISCESINSTEVAFIASQSVDYKMSFAPTTGGLYLDVIGYIVPNGGE